MQLFSARAHKASLALYQSVLAQNIYRDLHNVWKPVENSIIGINIPNDNIAIIELFCFVLFCFVVVILLIIYFVFILFYLFILVCYFLLFLFCFVFFYLVCLLFVSVCLFVCFQILFCHCLLQSLVLATKKGKSSVYKEFVNSGTLIRAKD